MLDRIMRMCYNDRMNRRRGVARAIMIEARTASVAGARGPAPARQKGFPPKESCYVRGAAPGPGDNIPRTVTAFVESYH